mgnify:CR=1 FL=1
MADRFRFTGFPAGRLACTPVPNAFFSEVLPQIDSLAELQVTLHALRLLYRKRSYPRYLTVKELKGDAALVAGLRSAGGNPDELLPDGLRRAVERGTLLRLAVERGGRPEEVYFVNGEHGRQAVARILAGELDIGQSVAEASASLGPPERRPDVYTLYEQNVGLLTPLIAEELAEAERLYPADWLEAAFRQAVAYNRRSWKYIQRILERWATEGRQDEESGRSPGRPAPSAPYRRSQPGRSIYER